VEAPKIDNVVVEVEVASTALASPTTSLLPQDDQPLLHAMVPSPSELPSKG